MCLIDVVFLFYCQVFGRGGEEMDFLQRQGIRVQVIPGTKLLTEIGRSFDVVRSNCVIIIDCNGFELLISACLSLVSKWGDSGALPN